MGNPKKEKNMILGKRTLKITSVILASMLIISGCSLGQSQQTAAEAPPAEDTEKESKIEAAIIEQEKPDLTGLAQSPLTGLYIDENYAALRPIGIMINNNHKCLPQSGISQADIYYEALAEGGISRIFAVFQHMTSEKIGPVRSAREYYTSFALDNDAIFIHHGGSPTGYNAIRERGLDSLDGMDGGIGFYRDPSRSSVPAMYEHSSYINADGIYDQVESKGYRMEQDSEKLPLFTFTDPLGDELELSDGITASDVIIPLSYYQTSEFLYDAENRIYERHQNAMPQIDEETENVLTVKNVIIQFTDMWAISGDEAGRMAVSLVSRGSGKYITNGKAVDITWKKDSQFEPTKWYNSEGEPLELNCGKTWVMVVQNGTNVTYGQ